MSGHRIVNRQFQPASQLFHKGTQRLLLQGMIHWGTSEFFAEIQNRINSWEGIILIEDTHYLDPREIVSLSEEEFDALCQKMKHRKNKTLEMMGGLLGLQYQWDVLKYPGPPHTLCADVSWREEREFSRYTETVAIKMQGVRSTRVATWDLMIGSGQEGTTLLYEILHQSFRRRGTGKETGGTKKILQKLFETRQIHRGFKNQDKARQVFTDLVEYFGSGNPDREPENNAFWLDKREQRALQLISKIEKLGYISGIYVLYGAGHFRALKKGVKKLGWIPTHDMTWTTAWTFPPCTTQKMMRALDAITSR